MEYSTYRTSAEEESLKNEETFSNRAPEDVKHNPDEDKAETTPRETKMIKLDIEPGMRVSHIHTPVMSKQYENTLVVSYELETILKEGDLCKFTSRGKTYIGIVKDPLCKKVGTRNAKHFVTSFAIECDGTKVYDEERKWYFASTEIIRANAYVADEINKQLVRFGLHYFKNGEIGKMPNITEGQLFYYVTGTLTCESAQYDKQKHEDLVESRNFYETEAVCLERINELKKFLNIR